MWSVKATCINLGILLLFSQCAKCLIIPEEVPTVLSLIYSNIPPIKKGTDSRVGVGFSLGEHADAQIILEIGPQIYTEPIKNLNNDSKRRRDIILNAAMRGEMGPWAQRVAKYQMKRKLEKDLAKLMESRKSYDDKKINRVVKKSDGSDWLSEWSEGMTGPVIQETPERKYNSNNNNNSVMRLRVVEMKAKDNKAVTDAKAVVEAFNERYGSQKNGKLVQEDDKIVKESQFQL